MNTNEFATEKFFDQYVFNVLTLLMKIFMLRKAPKLNIDIMIVHVQD